MYCHFLRCSTEGVRGRPESPLKFKFKEEKMEKTEILSKEKLDKITSAAAKLKGAKGAPAELPDNELEAVSGGIFDPAQGHWIIAGEGHYFVYKGTDTCPNCGRALTGLWIQNPANQKFVCEDCLYKVSQL